MCMLYEQLYTRYGAQVIETFYRSIFHGFGRLAQVSIKLPECGDNKQPGYIVV